MEKFLLHFQKLSRIIYQILIEGINYNPSHETNLKEIKRRERRFQKKQMYLESRRTKALSRDIQNFVGSHFEFLDHSSRFLITTGMTRMLDRARSQDTKNNREKQKK